MNKYIIEIRMSNGHAEYYTGKMRNFLFIPKYMFSTDKDTAKKFSSTQSSLRVLNAIRKEINTIYTKSRWGDVQVKLTALKPDKEVYHG